MMCWHCNSELKLISPIEEQHKFYHCTECDKWYEMFKEKERINGAVPVRFLELDSTPPILVSLNKLSI
jgi:hypothetical protein